MNQNFRFKDPYTKFLSDVLVVSSHDVQTKKRHDFEELIHLKNFNCNFYLKASEHPVLLSHDYLCYAAIRKR